MKVILKTDFESLGRAGDLLEVKDGFARNFLIPRQIVLVATTRNVKALEHQKRTIADQLRKERQEMELLSKKMSEVSITIPVQVGEEGKLFGSITNKDVTEALAKEGFQIDKRKVRLESPIKETGSFSISIGLHPDITATIQLHVVKS